MDAATMESISLLQLSQMILVIETMQLFTSVIDINSTLAGISSRNFFTLQFSQSHDLLRRLRASGIRWSPCFAELWKKLTYLLLTQAKSDYGQGFFECLPCRIRLAALTTGMLSGMTIVGWIDSLIQWAAWSIAKTAPTASISHGYQRLM